MTGLRWLAADSRQQDHPPASYYTGSPGLPQVVPWQ